MMFASVKQSGVAVNAPRRLGGASRLARGRANRAAVRCEAGKDEKLPKLPKSPREQVGQAAEAVRRAAANGKKQLAIEFTLPLIGATDLDDWPGGIRQQYQAVAPMVGELLKQIGTDGNAAEVRQKIVDDADAVVVLSTAGAKAMVFPTAETLGDLKSIATENDGLLATINNQIRTNDDGSNLISDLGIGPWRKKNEEFLASFELTYWISEQRIQGETVRLLKSYPHPWQLFVLTDMASGSAEPECIKTFDEKPSYKELESLLMSREGSVAAMSIIDRVKREAQFNATSVQTPPNNMDQK
tara:strand:+ start:179 stop:1078 length:900 start_codon:yes stop_codon:yes gene_type:complete